MMTRKKYEYIRANIESRLMGLIVGIGLSTAGIGIMRASYNWSVFGSGILFVGGVCLWVALFYNDPKISKPKKKRRGR